MIPTDNEICEYAIKLTDGMEYRHDAVKVAIDTVKWIKAKQQTGPTDEEIENYVRMHGNGRGYRKWVLQFKEEIRMAALWARDLKQTI